MKEEELKKLRSLTDDEWFGKILNGMRELHPIIHKQMYLDFMRRVRKTQKDLDKRIKKLEKKKK